MAMLHRIQKTVRVARAAAWLWMGGAAVAAELAGGGTGLELLPREVALSEAVRGCVRAVG